MAGKRPARLRPLTIRRLVHLVKQAGELPEDGSSGVMLPPFDWRFLGDELGCRPSQAGAELNALIEEGLLAQEGARLRVPDPRALMAALLE